MDNEGFVVPHQIVNKVPLGSTRLFFVYFFVTTTKLDEIGQVASGMPALSTLARRNMSTYERQFTKKYHKS
jgi:hypothetical protein